MSQTVDRALRILPFLGESERDLADIAALLRVHKSTALRLLQSMESQGFVRRSGSHRYRLGSQVFKLASVALGNLDIRPFAAPHIRKLGETTRQTVHLAAYDNGEVFYIDKYEPQKAVRMYSRLGVTAPLYCTGVAKAIIAHRSAAERLELAEQIQYVRHTERTIGGPEEYLQELEKIREQGYAVDDREHEHYIHCVAVPIPADGGLALHGLSVTAPVMTLKREQLIEIVPLLKEAAAAISEAYA